MLKALIGVLTFSLAQGAEVPFWKAKPKVYDRVKSREVIVSVTHAETGSAPKNDLRVSGGGQAAIPCEVAFESAQKYEEVAKQTGYVNSFNLEPDGSTMEVGLAAFGFSSRFKLSIVPDASAPKALEFKMVTGPMAGFAWRMEFDPVSVAKCEIGIAGTYRYDKFPIPKMFLEFGMEVVFQRMAISLRSYLEDSYKKRLDNKPQAVKEFAPK